MWLSQATADKGIVKHEKMVLEAAGSIAISHEICFGKNPEVRVTMTYQWIASSQYVYELGKLREKKLDKYVVLSTVLKGFYFSIVIG